uniref:A1 homeodomain mating type protein n=1 Tax=Heterobasidion occidentale TaxID=942053 RepID=S5RVZ4_9AGAM|nr:a1 homeodomain mating type protein [Heterobasidion occidentale]
MSRMDNSTIQRRLLRAEENLLDGVAKGPQALKSFYESWVSLGHDTECAICNHSLESSTYSLVKAVSARVEVLAEEFLGMHSDTESLTDDLMSELSETFTQFGLSEDPSIQVTLDYQHHPKKMQSFTDLATPRPSCYASAYDWLLDNLHNPYPSPDVKSQLAQAHGLSSKAIGAWFKQVRQEIGWSTLSSEIFSGSRSKTTRAASLSYISRDPDLPENVKHAFRVVRDKLEHLPISSRTPGKDTGSADTLQKLESMRNQVVDGTSVREEIDREIEQLRVKNKEAESSPPSPLPQPETLLSIPASPFTPDTSDEEEDTTPPPPVAGFKRRLDSTPETPSDGLTAPSDRPVKRSRTDKTNPIPSSELPQTRLSHSLPPPIQEPTPLPSSSTYTRHLSQPIVKIIERPASPVPFISRKRRLSDADLSRPEPKRPRGVFQGPRARAVSDPLPAGLGGDTLESLLSDGEWAGLFTTDYHTPPNVEPQPPQIVSIDDPTISTNEPCSTLALVPPAQTPSYPAVNLDDPIFSVSDVLALLSASSPDAATATHPTTPSATLPDTTALVPESPQATPQGAISTVDWGHFDEITLAQFPTCEPIATQGSVVPCLEGMAGPTHSMSLVDDMLLPFMFNPDMNPPPDTFGLDIYSGFGDQLQAWTGLWDLG